MPLQSSPWRIGSYLQDRSAILPYLEAVFEDGDPALLAAAFNDVAVAAGAHPAPPLTAAPSLAEARARLQRIGLRLAVRVPPASVTDAGRGCP